MDLDEYLSTGPPFERPVVEAVLAHLRSLGEMHVEPVSVGVFVKTDGGFVELRPMARREALSFPLARRVQHPRIARQPVRAGPRWIHVVNLADPADLDGIVRGWLDEAWASFRTGAAR